MTTFSESIVDMDTLLNCWEKLGQRERKVVLVYMHRLYAGQRKYGPIKLAKKDWTYEALEEALDACVYLSAALEDKSDVAFNAALGDAEREVQNGTVFVHSTVDVDDPAWDIPR